MHFSVLMVAVTTFASGAASSSTDANVVAPSFAWSSATRATLEISHDVALPGVAQSRIARTCRMAVAPHPKGWLISCTNAKTALDLDPEAKRAMLEMGADVAAGFDRLLEYMRVASEFAWVVSPKGEFIGIENGPALLAGWGSAMGPSKPTGEALTKAESTVLADAEGKARTSWSLLVARWAGAELRIGDSRKIGPTSSAVPLPGGRARTSGERGFARWLDCPGRPSARCVELFARTRTLPEEPGPANGKDAEASEHASAPKWSIETVVTLVAEPATLVPHRLTVQNQAEGIAPGGQQSTATIERWVFQYEAGARTGQDK